VQQPIAKQVPRVIEFAVKGAPLTQGSKVAFVINGRAIMHEMSDKKTKSRPKNALKIWRQRIANAATYGGLAMGWTGAILLECEFVFPRFKSHFTAKGTLASGAPMIPREDLDKLIRAVGDALSGVVYEDDRQITGFGASTKRFAKTREAIGGVRIRVTEL